MLTTYCIKMATYIPAIDVCYRSVVWLSCSCIVLKRLQISTQFLMHTTAQCLSQITQFALQRSTRSSPNFASMTNFRWFKRRRHSMANCGRIVRERTMLTMDSLPETNIALFSTPSPKWGPQCTLKDQLHDACCHLAIWYKISTRFLLLHTNYIAFCQIILVLVFLEICLINSLQQLQTSLLTHCSSTSTVVCGQSLLVDLSTTHLNWQRKAFNHHTSQSVDSDCIAVVDATSGQQSVTRQWSPVVICPTVWHQSYSLFVTGLREPRGLAHWWRWPAIIVHSWSLAWITTIWRRQWWQVCTRTSTRHCASLLQCWHRLHISTSLNTTAGKTPQLMYLSVSVLVR